MHLKGMVTLKAILLFLTIVENRYMMYKPVLLALYGLRIVFALNGYYLIILKLVKQRRISFPGVLLFQLLYSAVIVLSGVINRNITFGIVYSFFIWIGITNYILLSSVNDFGFIKKIDGMFKLIAIMTLALMVLLPGTVITYSYDGTRIVEGFFGGKNALPLYLLTGLCLNLLVYEREGGKKLWRRYLYPLICVLLLFASGSGTGSVVAAVFIILYYSGLYKLLNAKSIIIIHTIITFSVVVYRLQERYLYPIIVDVLHRDITLTYRTDIWAITVKNFLNNWFLGYGLGNNVVALNLVLPQWYKLIINETHNGFLDVALSTGVLGLAAFIMILICVLRAYDRAKDKSFSRILKLFVFVYFVNAISESAFTLSRLTFWSMLFIGLAGVQNE